ncbi:MAG: phosphatase PAP2 family protein, partial [Brachybacterium sp.]
LVVGWHRPSDVIGAIAVVAAWTFLVLAIDGLHTRKRRARAAARPGRGRRRRGADGTAPAAAPRLGAPTMVMAALLGLGGAAGLALGAVGLLSVPLPLDLHDASQQLSAFRATAALVAGGTGAWMALVLVLRTPISHRARMTERVP